MPSTYTLNNGIELIGTGEQSGTWGDTTNTNLGLLDAALDGQVTITLAAAGSSGSPNALPITDGTTSNGRNRMVVFADGGDLGATAYVQLTPNDAEKIIYIRNSLSGSRSVILFQGTYNASNDYEVPAGTTAVVYFDGAGAGAVAANVFNNAHFDALNVVGAASIGSLVIAGTAVTATAAELNILDGVTATAAELNLLDGSIAGTVVNSKAVIYGAAGQVEATTVEFDNLSGTGAVSVTNILDEDNMASDSATALATQQSIKAYVDSQVGTVDTLAEILAIGNTTGATDIAVDSAQKVQFRDAAIYINSSVDGQLDIVADTEIQIAATTIDVNGALDVSGTALVTGVLTTTAATVSNGGGQFNGAINVGVDDTGYDVKFFGATTGKSLLWDESADSLIVTGTTTLVGTTNLDAVDIDGATQIDATVTVGVDDTGYDVKFFGATAGAYMLWDESADDLILGGAAGLSVNSTALVTGVLTTTAATVHTGGITMPDSAKAIFGAGSDLEIYHDGTNNRLTLASANTYIQTDGIVHFTDIGNNEKHLTINDDGAVDLYHNNVLKLATTATGIDVTGTAVTDGLTVAGNLSVDGGTIKLDGNYPVGTDNVALGNAALDSVEAGGTYNVAIGASAGTAITTGAQNTAIGDVALTANTTASNNVAVGSVAMNSNTTGGNNVAVGTDALRQNTTASNNTAVGYLSLYSNTTAGNKTAFGYKAGYSGSGADTGGVYIGMEAGLNSTESNHFIGVQAGRSTTVGFHNTVFGHQAFYNNVSGDRNTLMGFGSGVDITSNDNTAVGYNAAKYTSSGTFNVALGSSALESNTTASNNTAVGYQALYSNTTGTPNVAVGYQALLANTTGVNNVAMGQGALSTNITGTENTAVGNLALRDNTGLNNSSVGYASMLSNTSGADNAALGTSALRLNTTGGQNTALGISALYSNTTASNNTAVGYQAGDAITTGINNTIIGSGCDAASTSVNAIALGHGVTSSSDYFYFGKASNVVYNNFTANASWTRSSDERWKKDINTNTDLGLDFINAIRTVTYKWKAPSELDSTLSGYNADVTSAGYEDKMYGFIAQEVKQALDDSGITNFSGWNIDGTSPDDKQGVSYEMFVVPLINAIQELSAKNDALEARLAALET
jgi:hypothetical protein